MLRNQTNAAKLEVDNKQLRGQVEQFAREKEAINKHLKQLVSANEKEKAATNTNVKQLIAANEKISGQLQGLLDDTKFLKQLKANLEKKEKKIYRKYKLYNPFHVRYDEL